MGLVSERRIDACMHSLLRNHVCMLISCARRRLSTPVVSFDRRISTARTEKHICSTQVRESKCVLQRLHKFSIQYQSFCSRVISLLCFPYAHSWRSPTSRAVELVLGFCHTARAARRDPDASSSTFAAFNVHTGPKEERMMTSGMHVVCDIMCNGCCQPVGWRYVSRALPLRFEF